MGAFSEFWAQVAALAEKERKGWPRWLVWETETDPQETGEVVSSPTVEAAREKYLASRPSAKEAVYGITARRATKAEMDGWDAMMRMFPHPTEEDLKRTGWRPGIDP